MSKFIDSHHRAVHEESPCDDCEHKPACRAQEINCRAYDIYLSSGKIDNTKRGPRPKKTKGQAALSEDDVIDVLKKVRRRHALLTEARTLSNAALAKEKGVTIATIEAISARKTLKHIDAGATS